MILLFTDYGSGSPYVGQLQARIESLAAGTPCINIHADLPAYDIRHTACLINAYRPHFPAQSIFLCVVDPGVGGERLPVVIQADGQTFIGPMNGLFNDVLQQSQDADIHIIDECAFTDVSSSFHGRDLFAPVAAALACGKPYPELPLEGGRLSAVNQVLSTDQGRMQEVVYIDHFGNAYTSIYAANMDDGTVFEVNGTSITYARTFSDCEPGACFWYRNSIDLVEIAANQGSAADILNIHPGTAVTYG